MKPDITVAIPTLNRGEIAIATVLDALKQSHQNIEIFVADQTKDFAATLEEINKFGDPRVRYEVISPPSLTSARNYILKNARADIVLFIDDDVKLDKDLVSEHLRARKEHPEAVAIAGQVMQDGFPIKKDVLRFNKYAIPSGVFTATEPAETNTFPGGNHSIDRHIALKAGGYDTRYVKNAFREESDMAHRVTKSGGKIFYNPKATLLHLAIGHGGTRIKQKDMLDNPVFYHNELYFTLRTTSAINYPVAILKKYKIYCWSASKLSKRITRSLYFIGGLIVSWYRLMFAKQFESSRIYPEAKK